MGEFLSDITFLRSAMAHLGFGETEFPIGIVTSCLVLVASLCVVAKNGFKATYNTLWATYWVLVISFRGIRWWFGGRKHELTDIEELVLSKISLARFPIDYTGGGLVNGVVAVGFPRDEVFVEIYVNGKKVTDLIHKSVRKRIAKFRDQRWEEHKKDVVEKEKHEILTALTSNSVPPNNVITFDSAKISEMRNCVPVKAS